MPVTAEDLADEAGDDDVVTQLERAGFLGGFVRDLRGRSRVITGANSRVLVFDNVSGARSFAAWVAHDPEPFFGGPSIVRRVEFDTEPGYLIRPALCDCPGAYPVFVGLVADGSTVLWLQVTGPRVSADHLDDLLTVQMQRSEG